MIIKGLNRDLYLSNNPIWVEITNLADTIKYVEITLTNITDPANQVSTNPLRLYPIGNDIEYNLQDFIKGNFPAPSIPDELNNDERINTNYAKFSITIMEKVKSTAAIIQGGFGQVGDPNYEPGELVFIDTIKTGAQETYAKTFIRGGKRTQESNITLDVGDVLSNSDKLPRWSGYPLRKFYIASDKTIRSTSIMSLADSEQMKMVGCDPFYVRYLNDKGGYSYWLFESWEQKSKFKSLDVARYRRRTDHLGVEQSDIIEVESRVSSKHFGEMRSLMRSPDIHVYNRFGKKWAKLFVSDNDFIENGYQTTMVVTVQFELEISEKPATIW